MKGSRCRRDSRAFRPSPAEVLERRVLLDGGSILYDINRTTDQLDPENIVTVGDVAYFTGRPQVAGGGELFKTDGTPQGTVLVKEIMPGIAGSEPKNFAAIGNTVLFSAADPSGGRELWKTDGTAAGTVRVKDIRPGVADSNPLNLTAVGDTVFFSADDGSSGAELWKSDGTAAGTVRVKDISAGAGASSPAFIVPVNGVALFQATLGSTRQLWRSDGTPEGTFSLPIPSTNSNGPSPRDLTVMGDAAYFAAYPGGGGNTRTDLWRSDGTPAGTYRVHQFNVTSSDDKSVSNPVASDNLLYFRTTGTGSGTYQLWRTDGTDAGTVLLTTVRGWTVYTAVTPLGGGWAVFPNKTTAEGNEPWVSDGTPEGTGLLADIVPGTGDSLGSFIAQRVGSQVYFSPNTVLGRVELWSTDGTPWNTAKVADVTDAGGILWSLAPLGEKVLFSALRFVGEGELFVYDPAGGAVTRLDAVQGPGGSGNGYSMNDYTINQEQSQPWLRVGPYVYFEANDGITGRELWRTNPGAGPGEPPVVQVADINPGGAGAEPASFAAADDGTLYFTASTLDTGREVYRLAPGGTPELIRDVAPGVTSSAPRQLSAVGNVLYFNAREADNGSSFVWRYDPADGSVTKVSVPLTSTTPLAQASLFVRAGNYSYFSAQGPTTSGRELYRTDGTPAGTRLVKDLVPGSGSSFPDQLTPFGGALYFGATNAAGSRELWKTDGTDLGTVKVSDFGGTSGVISGLLPLGNVLYIARSGTSTGTGAGLGLWRTDGTAAGTVQVFSGLSANQLAPAGDDVFFIAVDSAGGTGAGVYRYDPATGAVNRFTTPPGTTGFDPIALYGAGGDVYVVGTSNNRAQFELWRIDGDAPAAAGAGAATLVRVLAPRVVTANLGSFFGLGRTMFATDDTSLYFPAYDPATGIEPYTISLAGVPTPAYVVGRQVLYGPGKQALLPGYTATFNNVTNVTRGIPAVSVEMTGLPAGSGPTAADFEFAVLNGTTWTPMAGQGNPQTLRGAGAGGADLVTVKLPTDVRNGWLRVTVKAGPRTGLLKDDVFYFGNLVGDAASTGTAATVNARDLADTRANVGKTDAATLARYDFNGDRRINIRDLDVARSNQRHTLSFITAPTTPPTPIAFTTSATPVGLASAPTSTRASVARRSAWVELSGTEA